MELSSLALPCAAVMLLMMEQCSTASYNTQPSYHGRPRDERCPAVSEEQIICPQHARSCSLAKLDGCSRDGMYCCEDKCNHAICYDRHGTAIHSDQYRPYDYNRGSRPYGDNAVGTSASPTQYNGRQDNSYETRSSRNLRNLRNLG